LRHFHIVEKNGENRDKNKWKKMERMKNKKRVTEDEQKINKWKRVMEYRLVLRCTYTQRHACIYSK
jgi:hypothetical protein